jgi:UPF0271 protein
VKIDINSDMGEGYGPYTMGDDAALLKIVSSANVACGFHAGDPVIMDETVRNALRERVDVGAHVGFDDVLGFGRRAVPMGYPELEKMVLYQLGALHAIAIAAGHRVTHMSFHGALGNMAFVDRAMSDTLVRATKSFDSSLIVLVVPHTETEKAAEKAGMKVARTFLADRAYDKNGLLVSRKVQGSVIKDLGAVQARVAEMLQEGTVTTIEGAKLRMQHESILVHGDTPGAVQVARMVRETVIRTGGTVAALSQLGL